MMTRDDLLTRFRAAGFRCSPTWAAKEGRQATVTCYTVYDEQNDGRILTSFVLREIRTRGKPDWLFLFWMAETDKVEDDLATLEALRAKVTA